MALIRAVAQPARVAFEIEVAAGILRDIDNSFIYPREHFASFQRLVAATTRQLTEAYIARL